MVGGGSSAILMGENAKISYTRSMQLQDFLYFCKNI
jgi:hypothetical protein